MNKYGGSFWDERYSDENYVYGTSPNEFFKEQIDFLNPGRILMVGEGEGRNGIYAAQKGWQVDAVDFSFKAKEKALKHAKDKNVNLNYTVENLENYTPQKNFYDAAALIFVHLNEKIRMNIHKRVVDSLRPGGTVIMEVYSQEQMGRNSGGPQSPEMLYSIDNIKETFAELTPLMLSKEIVHLSESSLHSGEASVIRYIGKKETK